MRTLLVSSLLAVGCLAVIAPAQRKAQRKAQWKKVDKDPDWVTRPPAKRDFYRFVTMSRSNMPSIAQSNAPRHAERDGQEHLFEVLVPVVGVETATQLAATAVKQQKPLQHAFKFERLTKRAVPGNTLATAWILWEVPIRPVIEAAPKALRGRVERAFLRLPPAWEELKQAPAWFRKPGKRDGWHRVALTFEGTWPRDARRKALESAAATLRKTLEKQLAPLGADAARKAVAAALEDFHPVRRGTWFRRRARPTEGPKPGSKYITTAWVVWEVPVARMQRAVGKGLADELAKTLQR